MDKITYLKRSVKERITLPKISLQCILKLYNVFGVTKSTLLLLCFIPILVYNPFIILIVNHYLIFLCFAKDYVLQLLSQKKKKKKSKFFVCPKGCHYTLIKYKK